MLCGTLVIALVIGTITLILSNLRKTAIEEGMQRLLATATVLAKQAERDFQAVELVEINLIEHMESTAIVSDEQYASNRRVFSMAITAWSAKVWSSAICLSLKSLASMRRSLITPIAAPERIRGTAAIVRKPSRRANLLVSGYSPASSCKSAL
jgi:hypothetical protein